MEIQEVKRYRTEKRSVIITIRITPTQSEWMKSNDVSPTAVLNKGLEELTAK